MSASPQPAFWVRGDWNALFGFGTNILVNLLVLTGLLSGAMRMPDDLVFGRILPAVGLMMCLSTGYYAWLAWRLARETGRSDVCALPSGIAVAHMFVVVFVIMMPIAESTGDPIKGWAAGLTWVFVQSIVLMVGGFIAPLIRRITPRAALLGTLAGVSIAFISLRPTFEMFMTPLLGVVCFAVILVSWFGGVRWARGTPAGLVVIGLGCAIAWGSTALGMPVGGLHAEGVSAALTDFGFALPMPAIDHVFGGFEYLGVILVTAIPFGIYDLVEAMDNVESAAASGDAYPTRRVLVADGVVSMIGCLMGNPFINAVYIGHPGWKSMGGRIGYSAVTGLVVLALCWFGIVPVMTALIPVTALAPILLYIGLLIGAQAFQETPQRHAPAIILSLLPHLAAWGKLQVDNALAAAGTSATALGPERLAADGVLYAGLEILGGGAILTGLIWGAIAVFIIERAFWRAVFFTLAGAALTGLGFMHAEAIGIGQNSDLVASYVVFALILGLCARQGNQEWRPNHAGTDRTRDVNVDGSTDKEGT